MPYKCRIDPKDQIGVITLSGRIDGVQIREAMAALFGHPDWRAGYASFWDARQVESLMILPEDFGAISRTMAAARVRAGAGRGAWVVHGDLAKSIGVLFARRAQQQGNERRCFTDYAEALRWLLQGAHPNPDDDLPQPPASRKELSAD